MKETINSTGPQVDNTMTEFEDDEEDMLVSQLNMDITNQYVVFSVENEEYGIPILSVQEIISLPGITKISGVPDYIPGIINLRGNIIPLYVLRSKFNMEAKELNSNSIVIIVETGSEKKRTVGFIVDAVSDVVSITDDNLSETPEFSTTIDINYIEKIGKVGNRLIVIINLFNFFTETDKEALERTANKTMNM